MLNLAYFSNFYENFVFITSANDIGNKLFTGVNYTTWRYIIACVVDTGN
jgi:hypothetical protein